MREQNKAGNVRYWHLADIAPFHFAGLSRYDALSLALGVESETARVPHACWRGGRVAACGALAATRPNAADRCADGVCRERPGRTGLRRRIPGGTPEAWVGGGSQHSDRLSLDGAGQGVDPTIRQRTRCAAARPHSYAKHARHCGAAATNAHHSHCFRARCRSDRQRLRRKLSAAGRKRHRFVTMQPTMAGKWLELLKEIAPRVTRVAMLFNLATAPYAEYWLGPFKAAAASFAVQAIVAPVHDTSELDSVVAAQAHEPNGGVIVMPDTFTTGHRSEITSLAARYRLPAVYPYRVFAKSGGLLSYGDDLTDNFRRAAWYVDRILKGEKPRELPVQAPVKFELVINLKAAKALGLDVPVHLQQRADEVIE